MNKKLEIGTIVKVKGNVSCHGFKTGDIVTLCGTRNVRTHEFTDGKAKWYMMESEYDVLDVLDELNIGDKVQVICNDSDHRFKIGEIVKFKGHDMFEHLDGRDWWIMSPHEYKVVDGMDKKYRVVANKGHYFKIGDIITRTGGGMDVYGQYEYVNETGLLQWLDDEEVEEVQEDDVRLLYEEDISEPIVGAFNALCQFIVVGDITIAIPKDIPFGIARKHPDDEFNQEIGQALSQLRLFEEASKRGMF